MFADPQRFVGLDAALATLFRRTVWVNFYVVCTSTFSLVRKHLDEGSPRGMGGISAISGLLHHATNIQVLDGNEVIALGVVPRKFVEEVVALPSDGFVALGHFLPLFRVVGGPLLLP